jgi:hypothetical protein
VLIEAFGGGWNAASLGTSSGTAATLATEERAAHGH